MPCFQGVFFSLTYYNNVFKSPKDGEVTGPSKNNELSF